MHISTAIIHCKYSISLVDKDLSLSDHLSLNCLLHIPVPVCRTTFYVNKILCGSVAGLLCSTYIMHVNDRIIVNWGRPGQKQYVR